MVQLIFLLKMYIGITKNKEVSSELCKTSIIIFLYIGVIVAVLLKFGAKS